MKQENLSGALQENVLVLLCWDDQFCKLVRSSISPNLFESAVYREVASQACDFIDQFGEAVKEHLPDVLEHILNGSDQRKAGSYKRVLDNIFMAKDSINREYVVSKLNEFVRQQTLKSAIVRAVEQVEDGNIDQAEVEIQKGLQAQISTFEMGLVFSDTNHSLKFFNQTTTGIQIGIKELDSRDVCPRPGEMFMFIAPAKRGKSWGLTHVGKFSLLQRKKVLHITLEMSEDRVMQRYVQSFFAISKREARIKIPRFEYDQLGRLIDIDIEEVVRPTLQDDGIRQKLVSKINREFRRRPPLVVKQFPTGALTISQLNAYLDGLERFHKFIPDVIVLDYPDLMRLDSANLRVDTGTIYKNLRGIGVERHMAMVVASQGNRESSQAEIVTDAMVAEDFSKIATADNVITYNQTQQERALGLARLFVSNGRNDEDKFTTLISQSYATGQFCLDSTLMLSDYWDKVKSMAPVEPRRRRRVAEQD